MTSVSNQNLVDASISAARAAGKVLMNYFGKPIDIRDKKGLGLVTQADLESEQVAIEILKKSQPDFGILAEESGKKSTQGDIGRWVIDPLDGTTNFVHGFPMFCVSIAAEVQGELRTGVVYHPVLDDLYVAVAGQGASLNKEPIHVSKTNKLVDSLLTTGFTYRKNELLHIEMEAFERLSSVARAIRRPGSAALDLAYTARGVFDGFWERRLSPWDVAAGILLVQEAGGKATDFNGNPSSLEHQEIMASNGDLHQTLLQAINPQECPIET